MDIPRTANIIGRNIARFRYQQEWTQELLAIKMQLQGCYITRDIIANIETQRSSVTDLRIAFFAAVFEVGVADLFPAKSIVPWTMSE